MPYKNPEKQKEAMRNIMTKRRIKQKAINIEKIHAQFRRYLQVVRLSGLSVDMEKMVRGTSMIIEGFRLIKEAIPQEEAEK